jgi:hypothetical protein
MPSSLQDLMILRAISPRLATKTLENILRTRFDDEKELAIFNRFAVFYQDIGYHSLTSLSISFMSFIASIMHRV